MSGLDFDFEGASWVDITPLHERPRQVRLSSTKDAMTFRINEALAEDMKIAGAKFVKVAFAEVKKGVFAARLTPNKAGDYPVAKKAEGDKSKAVVFEITVKVMLPATIIRNVVCKFKADAAGICVLMPDSYSPLDYARFFGTPIEKLVVRDAAE